MEEMKNPNLQTSRQTVRALIAMAVIFFGFLYVQQIFHPKVGVENNAGALNPVVQTNAHKATPDHAAKAMPQASEKTEKLDLFAKPFFVALNWMHQHLVRNWGWDILLLTLGINLALLPLRIKSMRSQRKMQQLQPEIAAIRERYKGCKLGDPQMLAMNKEIAALHERYGVSMFGGFLPLLIQLPLLSGIYRMLHGAGELHHAPWLWLHDLAAPDPLHLLPIFFVVTMFLQQIVTPSPATDALQRKIMAVALPLIYCFIAWRVAAGLALYWSLGNVITIVQQFLFNHTNPRIQECDLPKGRPG
jgi:YidC/Oxa1 family membrane protein insertase